MPKGDTYQGKAVRLQPGNEIVIKDGGLITILGGGKIVYEGTGTQVGNKVYLTAEIADISTAGSYWIVVPVKGNITKIYSVIDGAITGADAVLSFEIAGTPITGGNITIANVGSAAGVVDSSTPSAANAITAGAALELITDGASTNTVTSKLTIEITVTV